MIQKQFENALKVSEVVRKKGDLSAERGSLWNAILLMMAVATTQYKNSQEGYSYFLAQKANNIIDRFTELNEISFSKYPSKKIHIQAEIVHLSWFIGNERAAESQIKYINSPLHESSLPGTEFWKSYCVALSKFNAGERFNLYEGRINGVEHFWLGYFQLMRALITDERIDQAEENVISLFNRRQRDSRWSSFMFEGSPKLPANWDLRKESIYSKISPNKRVYTDAR